MDTSNCLPKLKAMFGLPQQFMDWLQTFDKNILTYIKFCAVAILKPITGLFSKKKKSTFLLLTLTEIPVFGLIQ